MWRETEVLLRHEEPGGSFLEEYVIHSITTSKIWVKTEVRVLLGNKNISGKIPQGTCNESTIARVI